MTSTVKIVIAAIGALALVAGLPGQAKEKPGTDKGSKAVSESKRSMDDREGALDSYVNYGTDDVPAKMELILQEVFVNQQRLIQLEFMLTHGNAVDMEFLMFPSGKEIIPGYVFKPKTMAPGRRYPALVFVHGGFHERFSWEWFKLVRTAVDKGYVVVFPEYRGSRGYGPDYYENDYGVTDTADTLASADYIKGKDFVDPNRIGIVGVSRGGMITLLAIQRQPKLFRAAVDIVGLTDFLAYMAYKPDYRRLEIAQDNKGFEGKLPDKNLPAYLAVSPINHVDKIETPLLILNSTGDKIAPFLLHGGRLIDVMKARGKTFEYHVYDNAPGGHSFMNPDTWQAEDGLKRTFAFLDKYMTPEVGE